LTARGQLTPYGYQAAPVSQRRRLPTCRNT
jgi:hypothetical protein